MNWLTFNPIIVRFKHDPSTKKEGVWFDFQSYNSSIQTNHSSSCFTLSISFQSYNSSIQTPSTPGKQSYYVYFQSYNSSIQTAIAMTAKSSIALPFNPIIVRFKPKVRKMAKKKLSNFQSYNSSIQTS